MNFKRCTLLSCVADLTEKGGKKNKRLKEVRGYIITDYKVPNLGVYKYNDVEWCLIDIPTGLSICYSDATRESVVDVFEKKYLKKYQKLLKSAKYKQLLDEIQSLPRPQPKKIQVQPKNKLF